MTPIHTSSGERARLGGLDVTISLTPEEAEALGIEAWMLADWMHSVLIALARLRRGEMTTERAWDAITAVQTRLLPRLEGVRDASIRAHADAGGTYGDLALAMEVSRSTAQYRRDVLSSSEPSMWEVWATSGGPQQR